MVASLLASTVTAMVTVSGAEVPVVTVREIANDIASIRLDALAYKLGRSFELEWHSATDEQGALTIFGDQFLDIDPTGLTRPLDADRIIELADAFPQLRFALRDLRRSMRFSDSSAFFAYRCVECVRQQFVALGQRKADSWGRMRDSLRIGRGAIDLITKNAEQERHGRFDHVTFDARSRMLAASFAIVDRFSLYLDRGEQPLPSGLTLV